MKNYRCDTYGERFAAVYDEMYADLQPSHHQIDLLRELAGDGTALEIGVGTGRVAVPLARCGVTVIGVDSSAEMLARLRERATGLPIRAVQGDFVDSIDEDLPATTVAYAVFNTFFMLTGRQRQEACLRRVHSILMPKGTLVVEVLVPHPHFFENRPEVLVRSISADEVLLQIGRHDAAAKRIDFQCIRLRHHKPVELIPTEVNYLWPDELDDLATACGFQLQERWADWDGSSFTSAADKHISIYRKC